MKYRIFTNDVGPNAYSALCEVDATSVNGALKKAANTNSCIRTSEKILAIPTNKLHLVNGSTGGITESTFRLYGARVK